MREGARRRDPLPLAAAMLAALLPAAWSSAAAQSQSRSQSQPQSQSQPRPQPPRAAADYLARMDVDHDGRVSPTEYQAWMGYGFDAMDRDHDGVLAAAELPGRRGAPLTREAHRARLAAAFARQDRNRDGFLDARELAAPPR